ncbi:telomeric repeat-binding factor 1 isoform 2-T2 [Anableps anableps]
MECENKEELVSDSSSTIESVSFLQVTAVASGWMLDFMFVSLCRSFKEGNFDEFNENLSVFQALSQCKSLEEAAHKEKSLICAFLARVMHGKQLDVVFEEDESVMPLMSAATVWSSLENSVEDESLFKNITVLLFVQAVAVCLEKGQRASASSVLKWFEKRHAFPRNLGVKLSTVVTKAETYHPFLMNFSFNRLLETIQSFLDNYLKKNPSDFLIKAATKIVQSSQSIKDSKPVEVQDSTVSEKPKETTQKETTQKNKKTKCKLLYTKIPDLWTPETMKKPCVSVRRLSRNELCQLTMRKTLENSPLKKNEKHKKRKTPKKWTPQLDKYLKEGVKRHGQGNWSRILLDYDFEGRTGTMLKDRWRVLLRAHKVG